MKYKWNNYEEKLIKRKPISEVIQVSKQNKKIEESRLK